jgi:hypothetical protein
MTPSLVLALFLAFSSCHADDAGSEEGMPSEDGAGQVATAATAFVYLVCDFTLVGPD